MTFSQKAQEIKVAALHAELNKQVDAELGTGPERELVPKVVEQMILQKYGLRPIQFTNKEKKIIQKQGQRSWDAYLNGQLQDQRFREKFERERRTVKQEINRGQR